MFFVVLVSGFCLLHLPSSSGTYVSKCTNRDNSSSFYSSFFEVLFSGQMVACLEQVCHTLTCFVYTISPSSGTSVAKCTNLDKSSSFYSSSFLLKLKSKVRILKHHRERFIFNLIAMPITFKAAIVGPTNPKPPLSNSFEIIKIFGSSFRALFKDNFPDLHSLHHYKWRISHFLKGQLGFSLRIKIYLKNQTKISKEKILKILKKSKQKF